MILEDFVALTNLWRNINQNWIENQTSSYLVIASWSACVLITQMNTHVPSLVLTIVCRIVNKVGRRNPTLLYICLYGVCESLILNELPTQLNHIYACNQEKILNNTCTPLSSSWELELASYKSLIIVVDNLSPKVGQSMESLTNPQVVNSLSKCKVVMLKVRYTKRNVTRQRSIRDKPKTKLLHKEFT